MLVRSTIFALGSVFPLSLARATDRDRPCAGGGSPECRARDNRGAFRLGESACAVEYWIGRDRANRATSSVAIQIVIVMTLLTLAPSMVMLMTSFTRIVIVLGFVRTAIGVPMAPSNQIIVGLSLFLTFFLMGPVIDRVNKEALQPYLAGR